MFLLAAKITGTAAGIIGGAAGVIIVLVLIGAFILGARRKEREPAPELEPHSPERDSWATPPATPGRQDLQDEPPMERAISQSEPGSAGLPVTS